MVASGVFLRVKRKRTDAAPCSIVVEGLHLPEASPSLAHHLHTLNLDTPAQHETHEHNTDHKRLRFTRVEHVAPVEGMLHNAGFHQSTPAHTTQHTMPSKDYAFVSGRVHKECVVYDLLAPNTSQHPPPPDTSQHPRNTMGRDAVDARLLQMTLQYLQETQSVAKDATVHDVFEYQQHGHSQHGCRDAAHVGDMPNASPSQQQHQQQHMDARDTAHHTEQHINNEEDAMDWTYDYYTLGDDADEAHGDAATTKDDAQGPTREAFILVPVGNQWVVTVLDVDSADEYAAGDEEEDPDAEGHYANSYPDEDVWDSSDADSEQQHHRQEGYYFSEEEHGGHLSGSEDDW